MKTIYKKKVLCILLALTLVFTLTPAIPGTVENAYAAEPGISITDSTADKDLLNGWSYVESTKTLTLSGYNGGYIQGSGLNTLHLVLEGTNTITVDDANAKGIALGNNQNLNISGSGSLTITAKGGSSLIYGIECNEFTMTSGTVTINANSSKMVYGVNANSSLSVTGGKLTANITGTTDGYGLYCKTGKLTVDSGAEVAVKVTNNGSNNMYGIYNNAYTESVTDNGDIELAGTVTITRDGGSTGSGNVYGIANSSSNSNTDGVISITGGSVTVTNAHYGIVAFTKGHDAAFADVDISGGAVNVTSTLDGSNGIISWNNGVTISGGTVTANTASSALLLFDQDSVNKTGLVKITGDAKVSLTSTDYKALIVQGDESKTSTRVHQIDLTSGGSVTVKSTSDNESYYAFPVQGYFKLGSNTEITEGSFRSAEDGTNTVGGRLFQAHSTTKQVVVEYSTKLDKPTNLVWDGTTAEWDEVTGANKYRVILLASERENSGDYAYISNMDITNNSMDYAGCMLPGMWYYFGVAAYDSANQGETFSDFAYSDKKQMLGSIGTVTGFAWSGNTISWTAVEGATGYDVWVMKNGTQYGSVRDVSGTSLDLTSDIASGGDGTYYVSVSAYKLARGNYLAKGNSPAKIIGATPVISAAVGNVTVNGTVGTAITETQVAVDLTNDTFESNLSGNWITNLPAGLSQSVSNGGTTRAIITISGTPTAASTEQIAITIPADQLIVNTEDLTVTANADAKFNIMAPTTTYEVTVTNGTGSGNYAAGETVTITANAASDGHMFDKWVVEDGSASITLADANSATTTFVMPAGAVSVKATYVSYITVNLAAGEGSGTMEPLILKATYGYYELIAPDCTFTPPANKVFDKWQFSKDDSYLKPGETKTIWSSANGATLTAIWKDAPVTYYTVSFAANGGTGTMAAATGVSGEYTLPANGFTAPIGKHFKCWSVDGVEKAVGDTINVTANTTVIAQWTTTKLDPPTNLVWDGTTAEWDEVTGANKYRVILLASERENSGDYAYISNMDITNNSMDYAGCMLPGMWYYFGVAAYDSANQGETFSDFAYSDKKQMLGSIGTVTGFAWSGNTISWTAVEGATGYDVWVMKNGTQYGSVRDVSGTSLDLTSDIASGGDGTYYVSVSAYKLARGNYLAKGNSSAKIIGGSGSGGSGGGGGGGGGAAPTTPAQKPEIKPVTGGKVSLSADGTTATITPDAGKVVDKVLVNGKDMGAVTGLKGLKTGDKIEVLFKDEVKEPSKAETDKQVKAHMQKLAPKARSLKTKAGNVKVSFEGQFKDIEALGYTVKYKFYRSTKKASGYKYRLTTSKPSYTNTGGKKGTLYYYKAIALAYDKDGKLIAKTELKQCRYACRRWSK